MFVLKPHATSYGYFYVVKLTALDMVRVLVGNLEYITHA